MRVVTILLLVVFCLAGCAAPLRLNEIQVIGSHNSYKMAIDPDLLAQIAVANESLAASLDYAHLPIAAQLDLGLRKLELDIFYDPVGGRYQSPAGLSRVQQPLPYDTSSLGQSGFMVMHVQDIDFRSHCPRLRDCINQLLEWSRAHPEHTPIYLTINAKDGLVDLPGFVQPLPFDELAWQELDNVLRGGIGDKLFTPDEFRAENASLPEAVSKGWPLLDVMKGRFIVVLDHTGEKLNQYIDGHNALEGRAMFVNAPDGTSEAAIMIVNDPIADFDKIQALVRQGYIVRTRSDADTVEARTNDVVRRDLAFESGAQMVSTDYYVPDIRFSEFKVELPGGFMARCNPVLRPGRCSIK
ncbi:MAG: hypothetical protein ACI9HY_001701 [Planctomycetaceae bacterium]|jgi:hypothetical protein